MMFEKCARNDAYYCTMIFYIYLLANTTSSSLSYNRDIYEKLGIYTDPYKNEMQTRISEKKR